MWPVYEARVLCGGKIQVKKKNMYCKRKKRQQLVTHQALPLSTSPPTFLFSTERCYCVEEVTGWVVRGWGRTFLTAGAGIVVRVGVEYVANIPLFAADLTRRAIGV